MIPEERFGRWVAIGVPLLLSIGIVGIATIHMGYAIPWAELLIPSSVFVGIQIGVLHECILGRKMGPTARPILADAKRDFR
jgi:hypothetical protein